ncbi:MAG: hypothetical protein KKG00_11025, partial [Bacteroidetes bacterium]|nr:hypothetical protein [Bacteroidota bacterium]
MVPSRVISPTIRSLTAHAKRADASINAMTAETTQFLNLFRESLHASDFIKLSLGDYKGEETELKNVYVKKVIVKRQEKLSFLYRYKRRDVTKNYFPDEAMTEIGSLIGE